MYPNANEEYIKGVEILKSYMDTKEEGLYNEKTKITYGDFRLLKEKLSNETALEEIICRQNGVNEATEKMWFKLLYELALIMTKTEVN